jgi:siroheme synthase
MGLGSLQRISDELVNAGLSASTPAAAVHNGTTMNQQKVISTLSDIPAAVESAGLESPVIIIVGEVVSLSDELDWFQSADKLQRLSEEEVEHNTFDLAHA